MILCVEATNSAWAAIIDLSLVSVLTLVMKARQAPLKVIDSERNAGPCRCSRQPAQDSETRETSQSSRMHKIRSRRAPLTKLVRGLCYVGEQGLEPGRSSLSATRDELSMARAEQPAE